MGLAMIVTFDEQPTEEDLEHFGIKGMKWGVRRYENEDGSLTSFGKSVRMPNKPRRLMIAF